MNYFSAGILNPFDGYYFSSDQFDIERIPIYFDYTNALIDFTTDNSSFTWFDWNYKDIYNNDIRSNDNSIFNKFLTYTDISLQTITSDISDIYNHFYDDVRYFKFKIKIKNSEFFDILLLYYDIFFIYPRSEFIIIKKNDIIVKTYLNIFIERDDTNYILKSATGLSNIVYTYMDDINDYDKILLKSFINDHVYVFNKKVYSVQWGDETTNPYFIINFDTTSSTQNKYDYNLINRYFLINGLYLGYCFDRTETNSTDGTYYYFHIQYKMKLMDFTSKTDLLDNFTSSYFFDFTKLGIDNVYLTVSYLKQIDTFSLYDFSSSYINNFIQCNLYFRPTELYPDITYNSFFDIFNDASYSNYINYSGLYKISGTQYFNLKNNYSNYRNYRIIFPSDVTIDKTNIEYNYKFNLLFTFSSQTAANDFQFNAFRNSISVLYLGNENLEVILFEILDSTFINSTTISVKLRIINYNNSQKQSYMYDYWTPDIQSYFILYSPFIYNIFNVINLNFIKYRIYSTHLKYLIKKG